MKDELRLLQGEMKRKGIDILIIPTEDYHGSEYVSEYFRFVRYISGFTGEGTLLVTGDFSELFTDSRYYLQAEKELEGSGTVFVRQGKDLFSRIKEISRGKTLGFDGRTVRVSFGERIERLSIEYDFKIISSLDFTGIWKKRPEIPKSRVWLLDESASGEASEEKLKKIREHMEEKNADIYLFTSLPDIAWTLNLRASDIPCCPLFLSYFIVKSQGAEIFLTGKISPEIENYLKKLKIEIHSYWDFYSYLKEISGRRIILSRESTDYSSLRILKDKNTILDERLITALLKARKNITEITNIKNTHIRDGLKVTRFIYFLKHIFDSEGNIMSYGKAVLNGRELNEETLSEILESLRHEDPSYIGPSFETISAYRENAALPHYTPVKGKSKSIKNEGIYLFDSGGQYLYGTTDITRTVSMGRVSEEEKRHFTIVLKAMLRLGNTVFPEGTGGQCLDFRCREVFWKEGLDFGHGTGHGVGYILNVHEGPVRISYRSTEKEGFREGMLTSCEPGIYIEGKYGIRTENLMYARLREENSYGRFLEFEFLTLAPIDRDLIDLSIMDKEDIDLLNSYHRKVFDSLKNYLAGEELEWFKEAVSPIEP